MDNLSGGPTSGSHELFFLTYEVADIIKFRSPKKHENICFLTNLYTKKGWSLRRISKELGCSKGLVRKKLIEAGIDSFEHEIEVDLALKNKIERLRNSGHSYQVIADKFNLWKVSTRSKAGKWYGKTVRDLLL